MKRTFKAGRERTKSEMKVFYSTDFRGVYPTNTAIIMVAKTEGGARKMLKTELKKQGLWERNKDREKRIAIEELPTRKNVTVLLSDGNY